MPTIRKRVALTANGEIANVLSGSSYEFVGRTSRIQVALAGEGVVGFGPVADIQVGPELLAESANISSETAANTGARLPDYLIVDDMAAPGDRVIVRLRETSGVGGQVSVMVRIESV